MRVQHGVTWCRLNQARAEQNELLHTQDAGSTSRTCLHLADTTSWYFEVIKISRIHDFSLNRE
jgi:hypothetical protein